MLNISLCNNKTNSVLTAKVVRHSQRMLKISAVCSDTSTEALVPTPIFTPFSRMGHQLTARERR